MKNVIEDIRNILLQEDLDEADKENRIIQYYKSLTGKEQQEYLFKVQELFDEREFQEIDMADLLCNSKVEVQSQNIINVINKILKPDLSPNMTDKIINACKDVVGYKDILEIYKLEYVYWIFNELDETVKKDKFEEIFELILREYEEKNNDIINRYKVETLINAFYTMNEEGQKEKIECVSNLVFNYEGISLSERHEDFCRWFERLDDELKVEEIGQIIETVSKNENLKNSMTDFITNLWYDMDDICKIKSFKSVINQIHEIKMDDSNKKFLIEKLFGEIDKKQIIENIDFFVEQIHSINAEFDKSDIYIEILELISDNPELKNKYTDVIINNLYEEKNEELDLSSKEAFETSVVLKKITEDEMWKWDKYSKFRKNNILNCIKQKLKEENIDLIGNKSLCIFYDAITHNIINLNEDEAEIIAEYEKIISKLKNSDKFVEYTEIIEKNDEIPKDNIKDFMNEIKIYRMKNGRIPKKYYNYIIKETILGNIDKMEYEDVIKHCLVDMEDENLKKIGINNCSIGFKSEGENLNGSYIDNKMVLSQTEFENDELLQTINTLIHEGRHAQQEKEIHENQYDYNLYKMLKEKIILENEMLFYNDNYFDMENEFDARIYACMKTYEYLLEIGLTPEKIAEMEDSLMEKEISKNFDHNRSVKKYREEYKSINEIFLHSIYYGISIRKSLDPNLNMDCIDKYPILQVEFEYDDHGRIKRKSNDKIKAELDEKLETIHDEEERKKIIEFYNKIIEEHEKSKNNEQSNSKEGTRDYIEFLEENGYQISQEVRERLKKAANMPRQIISLYKLSKKYYEDSTLEERSQVGRCILEGIEKIEDLEANRGEERDG